MNVLVTDGDERAALAAVRSLGRREQVYVAAARARSIAGGSRFVSGEIPLPSPLASSAAFAEAVAACVPRLDLGAILPVSDAACRALVGARDALAPAVLLAPSAEAYTRLSDKIEVAQLARQRGLAVPPGREARDVEDALAVAAEVGFPVVLKPATSIVPGAEGAARKTGVVRARDAAALRAAWHELGDAGPALVQRLVPGWGEGVFVLRWRGRTRAAFAHRRIREKPPAGGVSVLCESVALDPDRTRRVEAIMDDVGYDGLAMAELKTDGREAWLMEFNARPWGSLQLAVDAGVDFPRLLLDAFRDAPAAGPPSYALGVRSRWLLGDLDHAIALARGASDARGRTGLGAALSVLLRPAGPRCRWEDSRAGDLVPFARALTRWLRALAR